MVGARRWTSAEPPEEPGDGAADLRRRVLLDEVASSHGGLLLLRPRATEIALGAREDGPGVGVDEELGDGAPGEPSRVLVHDRDDVGGLAVDRNLARPGERRAA